MDEESHLGKSRKPLSSASAIMHRHDKKRRKWFHNLLHPDHSKTSKHSMKSKPGKALAECTVSRSLEDVGLMNLSVIGMPQQRAASDINLNGDDDSHSVTSVSSCESDVATCELLNTSPKGSSDTKLSLHRHLSRRSQSRRSHWEAVVSGNSSDNEYSESDCSETVQTERSRSLSADDQIERSRSLSADDQGSDSYFSGWFSYLPFGVGYNMSGSADSLDSQSDEQRTLKHLLIEQDSQV